MSSLIFFFPIWITILFYSFIIIFYLQYIIICKSICL